MLKQVFEFPTGPKIEIKPECTVGKSRNISSKTKSFKQRCVQVCGQFHSPWAATTQPLTVSPTSIVCNKKVWALE